MSIQKQLADDLKQSMKNRDSERSSLIRMLKSKLLEREVELRASRGRDHVLDDAEARSVIIAYGKQRRDSIEAYKSGGRDDLAAAEARELEMLEAYLPRQLDESEVRAIVAEAIAEAGASSARDLGAVMKLVMPKVQGAADGKLVSRLVREALQAAQT